MAFDQWIVFLVAGLLLNLTPGPDVLFIVSRALRQGMGAGMVAALGITAGCGVHVAAAALGVSALIASSATAFGVLKWVGAAYLLVAGCRMLWGSITAGSKSISIANNAYTVSDEAWKSIFFKGFWTNVLNPKVALFFLAFLPQFIDRDVTHPALAFAWLGALFTGNGLLVNLAWAAVASWLTAHVEVVQRGLHRLDCVAGVMFMGFGLRLALADNPTA
jgi:threonine/homoserine/homoserine lactone efflux protein